MKIGILTFHSQLNYGGVLQCWALQTALKKLGHEVVVIDRWFDDARNIHDMVYNRMGWHQWTKFWIRSLCGLGNLAPWLRVKRTRKFLRNCLRLTPYHFAEWKDAPENLDVDLLVVGSDQVWHCGDWGDPRVYLLEGAPKIPAVAYAASFGMTAIPQFIFEKRKDIEAKPLYERGLSRFKAISSREAEGVRLCKEFGIYAEHVVDPTLLLSEEDWMQIVGNAKGRWKRKPCLVCYFLSEDIDEAMPVLEAFASRTGCRVKILIDFSKSRILPFPSNFSKFKLWIRGIWKRLFGNVTIFVSAGPKEFVKTFANADWIVSDSFHALVFATVFKKNVRILRPKSEFRQKMFARIEEFAEHSKGPLVSDGLESAMRSIEIGGSVKVDGNWLAMFRERSTEWLRESL